MYEFLLKDTLEDNGGYSLMFRCKELDETVFYELDYDNICITYSTFLPILESQKIVKHYNEKLKVIEKDKLWEEHNKRGIFKYKDYDGHIFISKKFD